MDRPTNVIGLDGESYDEAAGPNRRQMPERDQRDGALFVAVLTRMANEGCGIAWAVRDMLRASTDRRLCNQLLDLARWADENPDSDRVTQLEGYEYRLAARLRQVRLSLKSARESAARDNAET